MKLPQRTLAAGTLLQHLSRTEYLGTPLHFGRQAIHRYDCPDRAFGVLYLAFDLDTILMETMFHGHRWSRRRLRTVELSEVDQRIVRAVGVVRDLSLADLTAPGAMAAGLGLTLSQLASRRYRHTQRVAQLVEQSTDAESRLLDGTQFPSHNNYPAACIAVFDRATDALEVIDDIALREHAGWPAFVANYTISVVGP